MAYFKTPEGVIFDENEIIIEPNDNNPLWLEYVEYLANDGVVTQVDYEITDTSEVPAEVALWKIRFVLGQMELEDAVTTAISQLPEPQKSLATYIWNYGNSIDRDSNTIQFVQSVLGLNEMQVNNIYIQANGLTL
jgi:hypothetical protein